MLDTSHAFDRVKFVVSERFIIIVIAIVIVIVIVSIFPVWYMYTHLKMYIRRGDAFSPSVTVQWCTVRWNYISYFHCLHG